VPFDRHFLAVSHCECSVCTIFEIFIVEEYRDLEIYVRGHWPCDLYMICPSLTSTDPVGLLSFCCWQYLSIFSHFCTQRAKN